MADFLPRSWPPTGRPPPWRCGVPWRPSTAPSPTASRTPCLSLGPRPGGFRVWWRRLHHDSDEQLDKAHLMRMAGRFARRVRAFATAKGIPVIDCTAEERKHRIAEEYLREHAVGPGVFL